MQWVLNSRRRAEGVIIPGQPVFRMLGQLGRMFLKHRKVIKGIDISQITGVDQGHKQISDVRTMFGLIKKRIFAMQYGFL